MLLVVKVVGRNFIFKRVPIAPSAGNVSSSTVSKHREKKYMYTQISLRSVTSSMLSLKCYVVNPSVIFPAKIVPENLYGRSRKISRKMWRV